MSNHKTLQQQQAKHLYFTTAHTQKAIAKHLGITDRTMCIWVRKGNWAKLKQSRYHSPEEEVQQLYNELRIINNNINKRNEDQRYATKEELEAKSKILALISGHLKNTSQNWRNVAPEIDCEPIPEVTTQKSPSFKTVNESDIATAEEKPWDPGTLRTEYDKVAYWLALADHETEKYAKENGLPFERDLDFS